MLWLVLVLFLCVCVHVYNLCFDALILFTFTSLLMHEFTYMVIGIAQNFMVEAFYLSLNPFHFLVLYLQF